MKKAAVRRASRHAGNLLRRPRTGAVQHRSGHTGDVTLGRRPGGTGTFRGRCSASAAWVACFKAWDPPLKKSFAIKFLRDEDPQLGARFIREAQAQALLDHPHVCKVYEAGSVEGVPFIAMQLGEGRPLSALQGELTLEERVLVIRQAAEAAHAAHRLELVHRHMKPSNTMIARGEGAAIYAFVVDFGLIREVGGEALTQTGTALGTPSFIAPEQALGERGRIDRRTDVNGPGASLYEAIAGMPPHSGDTPLEVLLKVAREEPRPLWEVAPWVPRDLATVVMKRLEREPATRYESARALALDLARFLNGEPVFALPPSALTRLARLAWRHRFAVAIGGTAFVVAPGFGRRLGAGAAQRRPAGAAGTALLPAGGAGGNTVVARRLSTPARRAPSSRAGGGAGRADRGRDEAAR